jgi:hypothetical protein
MRWLGAMVVGAILFAGGVVTEAVLSDRVQSELSVTDHLKEDTGGLPQSIRQLLTLTCTEENVVQGLKRKLEVYALDWEGRPEGANLVNAVWGWSQRTQKYHDLWEPSLDVWIGACLTFLNAK